MGKLTQKAETFQVLRNTGKSIQDAYKMAGFKGDAKTAVRHIKSKEKSEIKP